MGLLEEAAATGALRAALDACLENGAGPGTDGVTLRDFSECRELELARLHDELLTGSYAPHAARIVRLPKPGGGYRPLAIGCVRDRVVQHALAITMSSALDGALHPFAWAWRKGRSTRQALAVVDTALAEGREWVFRGDVEEFFDRIAPALLLKAVEDVTSEPALTALIQRLLTGGGLLGGQITDPTTGTGQGSPLSPFLANLYLLPFDRAIEAAGFEMVRYGDDLCVPGVSRGEVEGARSVATEALKRLRLNLHPGKVEIRHRGEGFVFLGFQFDRHGRRPGARACRSLVQKVEETLRERPEDQRSTEITGLLRGWTTYYGTLAGVELPAEVRPLAEAMVATRADDIAFGPLPAAYAGASLPRVGASSIEAPASAQRAEAPSGEVGSVWHEAALQLAGATGTDDAPAVERSLRQRLGIDSAVWPNLAAVLVRFDGKAIAEILASIGRFGDAAEASALVPSPPTVVAVGRRGLPVKVEDSEERPRFSPEPRDAERLLELFGGAEHVFLRDVKVDTRIERQRVMVAPTAEHLRAHLLGTSWMGVYPLRGNNSTRFAAVRIVLAARARRGVDQSQGIPPVVADDARRLGAAIRALDLTPVYSVEPGRAHVVWVLFAEAVTGARARTLIEVIQHRAGPADPSVTREVLPTQETVKRDKPGTGVLLPLGLDPRSGDRAWFCDDSLVPVPDPCAWLRALVPDPATKVAAAVGVRPKLPPLRAPAAKPAPAIVRSNAPPSEAPTDGRARGPDAVALATSPFVELPRAQEVYQGCNVLRHFVDRAIRGEGLGISDRMLVTEILGRLGNESMPSLDGVVRHLEDYRPGMPARLLQRLYPHPTSCGRIRQRLPELTARVGCDCRFRIPPGGYPTPVLHAVGAADIPGMDQRVREAASRGGLAQAALAAMNEGRKELGGKAAAFCARLADMRRQARVLERNIAAVESELDALLDEAGDTPLETPSGTLRRVTENGKRRFILDV